MKKILFLIIFLFFIIGCNKKFENKIQIYNNSSSEFGINKGQIAPDFEITTIDNKKINLSKLRNEKPVLLYFWASWCPYCSLDFNEIKKVYPTYKDKVIFLAVDIDPRETKERIQWYKDKKKLDGIDFASDNQNLGEKYQVIYTTSRYAIARNGTLIYKSSGNMDENQWKVLLDGLANS